MFHGLRHTSGFNRIRERWSVVVGTICLGLKMLFLERVMIILCGGGGGEGSRVGSEGGTVEVGGEEVVRGIEGSCELTRSAEETCKGSEDKEGRVDKGVGVTSQTSGWAPGIDIGERSEREGIEVCQVREEMEGQLKQVMKEETQFQGSEHDKYIFCDYEYP